MIFSYNALSFLKLLLINQIGVQSFYFIRICRNVFFYFVCSIYWDSRYITQFRKGQSWPWSHGGWIYNYLWNQCLSPLMLWVRLPLRGRWTTLCDTVCLWLATGCWFSPDPPVSSTNKTGRQRYKEILLKVALSITQHTNNTQLPMFIMSVPK